MSDSIHGFLRAPRLETGDTIGIVAPSSPQRDDGRLRRGIGYLEARGFAVRLGEHLWERRGYLAGTDDERAADLNAMIGDPAVRMIMAGRGGYGLTRILDRIDYDALRRDPTLIVGFSDVTALHCAALSRAGLIGFAGPMAGVDFADPKADPLTEESFWHAVTSERPAGELQPSGHQPCLARPGIADGWLLPGNLTMLASLCGTPYLPDPDGAILVIEEIGEEAYRIDRLLSQLWNAGVLRRVAGIALGAFTETEPHRVAVESLPLSEVFEHWLERAAVPAITNVAFGHVRTKHTLPVGVHARIDGRRGTLEIRESGVVGEH